MSSSAALSAFTLDAVIEEVVAKPPRVVIYGPHKIGKTTFAMTFPGAIMLQTEDGEGSGAFRRFPQRITEYGQLMTALGALYQGTHAYGACVLDSLDWLEPIVWRETARRHGKSSIEDFDFGKGYFFADEVWAEVFTGFDALRNERNMAIVCTAHAAVTKFIAPNAEPYDRYSLKLHKRAAAKVQEWADVIGFAHWQVNAVSSDLGFKKKATRGISTGQRLLALEERPAWEAGNRFQLPPVMSLDGAEFLALLAQRYEPVGEYPAEEPIAPHQPRPPRLRHPRSCASLLAWPRSHHPQRSRTMAQFNGEFDATTVDPAAPMEVLPDGWVPMAIVASKWEPTKKGDGTYLELELQVIDGPNKGRKAWDRLNLANPSAQTVEIAQKTLSAICHATGVLKVQDSAQLHNLPMLVKLRVKQGEKGPMNEVKGYKKLDGAAIAATPHVPASSAAPAATAAAAPSAPATPPWAQKRAS